MSADAYSVIVNALGFTVSAVAILYLARQTRLGRDQAAIAVNHSILSSLRELHVVLAQRELLGYFYDDRECPPEDPRHREVTVMADTFADILCSGLHAHEKMPASESLEPWRAYCADMLRHSPVLRARLNAAFWPHLDRLGGASGGPPGPPAP
ncbi:hypothetical protein [Streptomyces griseosporeus]|uniref:hypothetical protein n=1 Tax=Streptomyces griseosporeus TaxID=1910 RepID=UPI0036FE29A9